MSGEYIQVHDHHIRLLMSKYFLRLNSSFRYGSLQIHPQSGEITAKFNSLLDEEMFKKNFMGKEYKDQTEENIVAFIKNNIITAHQILVHHSPKILYMINLVHYNAFDFLDPQNKQKTIRFPSEECQAKLEKIRDILVNKCENKLDMKKVGYQEFTDYFRFQKQNPSQGLSTNVYSELFLKEDATGFDLGESSVNEGGFAEIFKAKLNYRTQQQTYIQRTVAVKREKDEKDHFSRVKHEKNILEIIQDKECPYIAKFYHSKQDPYKDYLMLEYYPLKSLDHFKNNFSTTMSLNNKIYFLYQICQGINFLTQNKIIHLDLKPANILISKGYVCKISDFGESYNYDVCKSYDLNDYRPGRTIPYAIPEALRSNLNDFQKYNEKADTFSLGVIISDLLFDEFPFQFKRGNQKKLLELYVNSQYQYYLPQDYFKQSGPNHLIKLLTTLISRCIEEKEHRPYIEWIVIIMKDALLYLEKMY